MTYAGRTVEIQRQSMMEFINKNKYLNVFYGQLCDLINPMSSLRLSSLVWGGRVDVISSGRFGIAVSPQAHPSLILLGTPSTTRLSSSCQRQLCREIRNRV